ncbi:MAG: alanine racemase, partial [Chloroflexota bacterium]
MNNEMWYVPKDIEAIPSPALLLFKDRVEANIQRLVEIAGDVNRLRPHVKTHKMTEVVKMHQAYGIQKLKCATIAEAEMVASCGVSDILLAYQPVGPNQARLIALAEAYPRLQFGCLVDNETVLRQLQQKMETAVNPLNVWIDIDNGNGRTGIAPDEQAANLAKQIVDSNNLNFAGLHVYDGQFGGLNFDERKNGSDKAFKSVERLVKSLEQDGVAVENIVAGGSPTFPVHTLRQNVDLSPGTYIFWDAGYG